jgi:hypothetical protein
MTKGDKQMLIDTIRDAYREMTGRMIPAEPIATVNTHRPAANAGNIAKIDMQLRRNRRQRRLGRTEHRNVGGWKVRAW